ncbi:hypothetical protein ACOSP7_018812 [Xanthoceras sorbifolium]
MLLWGVWSNRNAFFHHNRVRQAGDLVVWIQGLLCEFQSSLQVFEPSPCSNSGCAEWIPPPLALLKLNTDDVFLPCGGRVGLGGVIRNDVGWVVVAFAKVLCSFCVCGIWGVHGFKGRSMSC